MTRQHLGAHLIIGLLAIALLALSGCADDSAGNDTLDAAGDNGAVYPLMIWNNSQFDVEDVTATYYDYGAQKEKVERVEVLEVGETVLIEQFPSGSTVFFVRSKVAGGDLLKVTTTSPVYVSRGGYTLILFDDTFRLLTPDNENNPFVDPGSNDVD